MRVLATLVGMVAPALQSAWAIEWPTDLPFEDSLKVTTYPVYGRTVVASYPNYNVNAATQRRTLPTPATHYNYAGTQFNPWAAMPMPSGTWANNRYLSYMNPWGANHAATAFNAWGNQGMQGFRPWGGAWGNGFNYPHWQTLNQPTMAQGVYPPVTQGYNPWFNNLATAPTVKPLTAYELPRSSAYPVAAAIAANPLVPLYNGSSVSAQVPHVTAPTTHSSYHSVPTARANPNQALIYPNWASNTITTWSAPAAPQLTWTIPTPPPAPVAPSYQGYQAFDGANYTNPNNVPPPPLAPLAPLPLIPPAPPTPPAVVSEPLPPAEPLAPEPPAYGKVFAPILD